MSLCICAVILLFNRRLFRSIIYMVSPSAPALQPQPLRCIIYLLSGFGNVAVAHLENTHIWHVLSLTHVFLLFTTVQHIVDTVTCFC